ncbi:MAG: hypothetical protein EBY79_03605 [Actinobacteria bacterium]|nr:hypothetical protein [Actinomycetota bacterium]
MDRRDTSAAINHLPRWCTLWWVMRYALTYPTHRHASAWASPTGAWLLQSLRNMRAHRVSRSWCRRMHRHVGSPPRQCARSWVGDGATAPFARI